MTTSPKYTDAQIEKVVKKLADGISIEHGRSSPLKMGAVMLRSLLTERQAVMQRQGGSENISLSDALRCLEDHAIIGYMLAGDDIERMRTIADKLAPRDAGRMSSEAIALLREIEFCVLGGHRCPVCFGWDKNQGETDRHHTKDCKLAALLIQSAQTARVCPTCNGNGMIGGPSYAQPDEGGVPCPDCSTSLQAVVAQPVSVPECPRCAECSKYLKEGETPLQRMDRDKRDSQALLSLLIEARKRIIPDELKQAIRAIIAAIWNTDIRVSHSTHIDTLRRWQKDYTTSPHDDGKVARDAERYRFLRECKSDAYYVMAFDPEGDAPCLGGEIMDNAIDAAIKEQRSLSQSTGSSGGEK